MSNQEVSMAYNHKRSIEWINQAYEQKDVTFPDGFSKDAIQNAIGARKSKRSWKGWSCNINVVRNNHGIFVTVEDNGTVGLCGPNLSQAEIAQMTGEGSLPDDYRLANFSSMFNSGATESGGGLYGAGKSVFAAASKSYSYGFDSLTEDGRYIFNRVSSQGRLFDHAFENEEAKKELMERYGLNPKTTVGTRVFVIDPIDELVDSIESGAIEKYIRSAYWLCIEKMQGDDGIYVNGQKVILPPEREKLHEFKCDNINVADGYRIKHASIYIEKEPPEFPGIYYYRRGMKVGIVDIMTKVPAKVRGRFWGWVEVDETWEQELGKIEDQIHYGINEGKSKRQPCYRILRNYLDQVFEDSLKKWGYIKDQRSEDERRKDELNQIANELQDLFARSGFSSLGTGPKKPDFDVRWQDVDIPQRTLFDNDKISYKYRIKNMTVSEKTFKIKHYVEAEDSEYFTIENKEITVQPGDVYIEQCDFVVDTTRAAKFEKNNIVLSVGVKGERKKPKRKTLEFWYAKDRPAPDKENVLLTVHSCDFPKENTRRVDGDETLRNVTYRIENNQDIPLTVGLRVRIHNMEAPGSPIIKEIGQYKATVLSHQDEIIEIGDIAFDKAYYDDKLLKGVLELRADLSCIEANSVYTMGEKITSRKLQIYYQMNEKTGLEDSFLIDQFDAPDEPRRSWTRYEGSQRYICFNIKHPAYLMTIGYEDIENEYLRSQMLQQFVMLYLQEGKFDKFLAEGQSFDDMSEADIVTHVMETIEKTYYDSFSEEK